MRDGNRGVIHSEARHNEASKEKQEDALYAMRERLKVEELKMYCTGGGVSPAQFNRKSQYSAFCVRKS